MLADARYEEQMLAPTDVGWAAPNKPINGDGKRRTSQSIVKENKLQGK